MGGDGAIETGTCGAEDGEEREERFSLFGAPCGIEMGKEVGGVDCDTRLSPGVARVTGTDGPVVVATLLKPAIASDSDSNFGISKKTGLDGGTGGRNGFS
jgi:hypothetical protein